MAKDACLLAIARMMLYLERACARPKRSLTGYMRLANGRDGSGALRVGVDLRAVEELLDGGFGDAVGAAELHGR
ncbi:Uncharacterised protein [Arthrobacter agilis]|nr:Uncharacterised protein [Arthrobacter agilis]